MRSTGKLVFRGVAVGVVSALIFAIPASAELPISPVLETGAWEWLPAAGTDGAENYLSWTEDSLAHPRHSDEFIRSASQAKTRVNPAGTEGFGGGMDGSVLVYQQVARGSNLRIYDAATHTYSSPPPGLNNENWQWAPSYDDPWILYGENRFERRTSPWKVYLFNVSTGERRLLDAATYRCRCIWPGQVQGNYATWTVCRATCEVYLHDIAADHTQLVANPADRQQYFGGVDSNGTVYLARSGNKCGQAVRIVRYALGSAAPTTLYSLPPNREIEEGIFAFESATGTDTYLSRFACSRHGQGDVYVIPNADGPVPASSAPWEAITRTPTTSGRTTKLAMEGATP